MSEFEKALDSELTSSSPVFVSKNEMISQKRKNSCSSVALSSTNNSESSFPPKKKTKVTSQKNTNTNNGNNDVECAFANASSRKIHYTIAMEEQLKWVNEQEDDPENHIVIDESKCWKMERSERRKLKTSDSKTKSTSKRTSKSLRYFSALQHQMLCAFCFYLPNPTIPQKRAMSFILYKARSTLNDVQSRVLDLSSITRWFSRYHKRAKYIKNLHNSNNNNNNNNNNCNDKTVVTENIDNNNIVFDTLSEARNNYQKDDNIEVIIDVSKDDIPLHKQKKVYVYDIFGILNTMTSLPDKYTLYRYVASIERRRRITINLLRSVGLYNFDLEFLKFMGFMKRYKSWNNLRARHAVDVANKMAMKKEIQRQKLLMEMEKQKTNNNLGDCDNNNNNNSNNNNRECDILNKNDDGVQISCINTTNPSKDVDIDKTCQNNIDEDNKIVIDSNTINNNFEYKKDGNEEKYDDDDDDDNEEDEDEDEDEDGDDDEGENDENEIEEEEFNNNKEIVIKNDNIFKSPDIILESLSKYLNIPHEKLDFFQSSSSSSPASSSPVSTSFCPPSSASVCSTSSSSSSTSSSSLSSSEIS